MVRFLPLALLAGTAACALPSSGPTSSVQTDVPLSASIRTPLDFGQTSSFRQDWMPVRLSRPAHIVLFEIRPGAGVMLVSGGEPGASRRPIEAGYSTIPVHNWLWQLHRGRGVSTAGYVGGPRFFLLVASDRPLPVDAFGYDAFALRRELGYREAESFNPFSTMDRLLDLVVPAGWEGEVVTDVWVDWGTPRHELRLTMESAWVRISCNDGSWRFVPTGLGHGGPYDLCTGVESRSAGRMDGATRPEASRPAAPDAIATGEAYGERGRKVTLPNPPSFELRDRRRAVAETPRLGPIEPVRPGVAGADRPARPEREQERPRSVQPSVPRETDSGARRASPEHIQERPPGPRPAGSPETGQGDRGRSPESSSGRSSTATNPTR
jgi:hypothetical protein